MASLVDEEILRFEITMYVAELVEGINGTEHFRNVESGVLFLQYARIVEQGTEVTTGNVLLIFLDRHMSLTPKEVTSM